MPELPEVETIKRQLAEKIIGKRVKSVDINLPKMIKGISADNFEKNIISAIIKNIRRRAKIIIIDLSNNFSLLIHLKLTGQLIYQELRIKNQELKGRHTHIVYYFTDGSVLLHNDMRQFGYAKLVPTVKIENILEKEEKFGPEPLEKKFTLAKFKTILLKKSRIKIKQFLMDQTNIAGIGNIYSDEILYYAGVRPIRLAINLKPEEIKKIYNGIKKILPKAIKFHGTSMENYVDANGKKGKYESKLKVYDRTGEKCPKSCGGKVETIKIAGRSAHFCPKCQK